MKNLHRHAEEGFQVCDGVHCQAFKGINQNAVQIMAACRLTKGLVVTDQEGKLISAFFHSNCGGETATGESVWLARQSYLSSVQDQFCSQGRNFTWHKNIPLKEWINYIKNIYPSFSVKSNDQLNFSSSRRAISYVVGSFSIPFNKVRADWNLKSAFFSVTVKGDRVELSGRGYGHGVGLCQEGAMHMARLGYSYQEIVSYYFKNVNIINFDANKN